MGKLTGVVFGSTGLIGNHLVEGLLTDEFHEEVVMVTRKPVERSYSILKSKSQISMSSPTVK